MCVSHEENVDIMFNWIFGRAPKIDNILKSNEYFKTKFGQYMAKSHNYVQVRFKSSFSTCK